MHAFRATVSTRQWRLLTLFGFVMAAVLFSAPISWAGWHIDAARFHISAHGDLTCLECHDDLPDRDVHPDPANVSRSEPGPFEPDTCLMCHDYIWDDIEDGRHGRRKVRNPDRYRKCVKCHNPHYSGLRDLESKGLFEKGRPRSEQCGVCHEEREELPEADGDDQACLSCHRKPDTAGDRRIQQINGLCFSCHVASKKDEGSEKSPLIDEDSIRNTPHSAYDCLVCHFRAADYRHDLQPEADCRGCHLPHGEKEAHDAHVNVDCQTCHFSDISPVKDDNTGRISARPDRREGEPSRVHRLADTDDRTSCRRCHISNNRLGAAAMILPAKSVICMPCHTATFSAGDTVTIISLLIFLFGLVLTVSVWFSGGTAGDEDRQPGIGTILSGIGRAVFSSKIVIILKALVVDGLFQRRLYAHSPTRWMIHALIFWPFVIRFVWGLITMIGFSLNPENQAFGAMIDKNHPLTALVFDLTGLLVILGVILAVVRRRLTERAGRPAGLPGQDVLAVSLMGGIVLIGFLLEGMRIAMTVPQSSGAAYAFIGYAVSRLFENASRLSDVYGYVWYIHALLTGAFIAYMPFSRMFHIILAPLALAVSAVTDSREHQGPRSDHKPT